MVESGDALSGLRDGDLFGALVVRWDDSLGAYTDQMGIPLSRSAVKALRELVKVHLRLSPEELASMGNHKAAEQMPSRPISPMDPKRFA